MRKLLAMVLLAVLTLAFSQEWYSAKQRVDGPGLNSSPKDTTWFDYTQDPAYIYIWTLKNERATYFNANDFGFDYPVKLNGLSAHLRDSLQTFTYKVYDKDGTTVLFEHEQLSSVFGDNDLILETPMIMTDDFWLSILPQEDGKPSQATTELIDSEHSYYGLPGGWEPFYKDDERYEWLNYVALEAYVGEDTYPPIVRGISGLNNFMGYDATVTVSVQDMSGVVSPMPAQYDTGAGWVDISMNQLKSDYYFAGTVPGQPNGATALFRFYMEDVNGNGQWSDEYTVSWGKDTPLMTEDFENEFPPMDWTLQTTGAGFTRGTAVDSGFDVYEGKYYAVHWDDSGTQDDWLITKPVVLPPDDPTTFSFWQSTYWSYYFGVSEVAVSTDLVNWTTVYTPPYQPDDAELELLYDGVWIPARFSLSDYAGQTVYVGFHYQGDYNHQWYIDNVEIILDADMPVITDIYANTALLPTVGAYLNNPMDITLELTDFTGVKSVIGHYTFDGTNYTDIVFNNSKSESGWSATIPASADPSEGSIYFTLEDLGGVSGDTEPYNISFVADEGEPTVKSFSYGDPVFVGSDMTLELQFEDESGIASVQGFYSKDNWSTETPVTMTASKIHPYTYTGTIPAEAAETFAQVRFVVTDVPGNILNTDHYNVKWLEGHVVFFDDFDGSNPEETWYTDGGTWAYVTNEYHSATTSLHDSPDGNYGDNLFSPVRTKIFDFSEAYGATLFLWAKVDLETGWDYTYLQATTDETTWIDLYEFNGEKKDWEYYAINLGPLALQPSVRLRFRLVSDAAINCDGMYIDDVTLAVFTKDYSAPLIKYSGPDVFVADGYIIPREFTLPVGLEDYNFSVELTDISDISEVKVVYSVDGGPEQESISAVSSGTSGTYDLKIPAQPAGSKVWYRIVATDNSEYNNTSESKSYMIRFGNYLCYQNGDDYTDYLDMIGNTPLATAQAVATRITMGPMDSKDHYRSNLVGITIDNYISTEDGYPSDPMYVHVWADEGGKPGRDIIEPIYTVQDATDESSYEITYVDLRPYADKLSNIEGDVFVGYTSAGDVTNLLYEVVANHLSVPGYVAFERSWLGKGDLSALSWELDPTSVYHISAVIGDYTYIDAPLPPQGLTATANISAGTIELNWLPNPEADMSYYNVYRGDTAGFAITVPVGTVAAGDPKTYLDTPSGGGDAQGNYYYKITAVDADENESSPSMELMANPSEINENLPLETKLYQNYPNPFNPTTTIKFSLAQSSRVNLSVYNSNGQIVADLVNGDLSSGHYGMKFDGSSLTSGVYYTVLKVNEKVMTSKMIMLK